MNSIVERLLTSEEPSIRYKMLLNVLGKDVASNEVRRTQDEIRSSPRVSALLSERGSDGLIPHHPYKKWVGAHWVLADLADTGYPQRDKSLSPLLDQVYTWLLSPDHMRKIRTIEGRVRRCASQEANVAFSSLRLGLADERTDELVSRLQRWQWPDGGWNCDKRPEAHNSSFMETLIPLRALALHARVTGDSKSREAAARAAEVFLKRRLFRRQRDSTVIDEDFAMLHYPCYWHYDILFGLKVMAEAGFIADPRCKDALDLLESKRLPDGGFPAEVKYYSTSAKATTGRSLVDWGGVGKTRINEFVTADALYVLKMAGRLR